MHSRQKLPPSPILDISKDFFEKKKHIYFPKKTPKFEGFENCFITLLQSTSTLQKYKEKILSTFRNASQHRLLRELYWQSSGNKNAPNLQEDFAFLFSRLWRKITVRTFKHKHELRS